MKKTNLTCENFVRVLGQEPYAQAELSIKQVAWELERYFAADVDDFEYQSMHLLSYARQSGEISLCLAVHYRNRLKSIALIFDFCTGEKKKVYRDNRVPLPMYYKDDVCWGQVYKSLECTAYVTEAYSVVVDFFRRRTDPQNRLEAERMALAFAMTQLKGSETVRASFWSRAGIRVKQVVLDGNQPCYAALLDADCSLVLIIGKSCRLVTIDRKYLTQFS